MVSELDVDPAFEGRRFSAIAFTHPAIGKASVVRDILAPNGSRPRASRAGGWNWYLVEVVDGAYRYRSPRMNRRERSRDGGYAYPTLLAMREGVPRSASQTMVLASPFVGLLGRLMHRVQAAVAQPRVTFVAADLDRMFAHLVRERSSLRATQVTLQPYGVEGVSLVSLTGSSPLISALRRDLGKKAQPYSARLEVPRPERDLRLYLDRRGNFWWYQDRSSDFTVALSGIAYLLDHALTATTHLNPLAKLESLSPRAAARTTRA